MGKVRVRGINLHYRQRGTGPDVMLVHGAGSNLGYWLLTVTPRLAEQYRVTTYDLRGHGLSDVTPSGYSTGELAHDLDALMDGLGIQRAHLVGHSYGAAIALHHAARRPERVLSLVVTDSVLPGLGSYLRVPDEPQYARLRERLGLGRHTNGHAPAELLPGLLKESFHAHAQSPGGPMKGLPVQNRTIERLATQTTCFEDLLVVGDLTEEAIRSVGVPTLAIYHAGGFFLDIGRYLEANLPRCRLVVEPGDHFFPAASPEILAERLLAHFASVNGEPSRLYQRVNPLPGPGETHE